MKKTVLTILAIISLASCSKEEATQTDNTPKLPPETQTGANTFGVTINGKVYIPRSGSGSLTGGSGKQGMILWRATDYSWYELEIIDGQSTVGFQMYIHMHPLASVGRIILQQSNFHNNIDSTPFPHIYFKIFDNNISNYAYYGSVANEGEINITRLDSGILSGNFKGKFVRYDNPNEFITITDGRFDINGFTLPTHPFP